MTKENENPTAPKEVTVAKTAKEAAIDPETGDEIIGMDINLYDDNTDEVVKCEELEKRLGIIVSKSLHELMEDDFVINSKEDAEKLHKHIQEGDLPKNVVESFMRLQSTVAAFDLLDLKASITLDKSVNGIKQIYLKRETNISIVTENCYAHHGEDINLIQDFNLKDNCEYTAPTGSVAIIGKRMLCSVAYNGNFNVYYDSIDDRQKANLHLEQCLQEMSRWC